jgi:hypothetical protein
MAQIDKLRAARDSYAVKLRDFVRIFTRTPTVLVCFFEGEDVKYFGPRIDILRPDLKWEAVNCGGKDVVFKLWEVISTHELYSHARTSYFFDQDFDDAGSRPVAGNVYVTPCYSVENLYVTEAAARRILRGEFGLNEQPDEEGVFARCVELFKCRLGEFLTAIEPVNAWILFHRRAEVADGATRKLNLASLNPNTMVSITLEGVNRMYSVFDLEAAVGNARPASDAELTDVARSFEPNTRYLKFRGKFQAFFMRMFLMRLQSDANSHTPRYFPSKRRVPLNVSASCGMTGCRMAITSSS